MNSNTREFPTSPPRLSASRKSTLTTQPTNRSLSRETSTVSLASGAKKSTGLEAGSKRKANHEWSDPQDVQGIVKFRTAILNVDPCAKFFADGELLKVTHSRCGGKFTQNSLNDISNFQDHVGICQSIHPGAATPVRPTKLYSRCPGFGFEELCGEVYGSLSHHERQQVKSATEAAGFVWVDSRGKWSLIAGSCLRKIPSRNELIQPCQSCLDAVELSNIKGNLLRITSKPKYEFINPFSAMDATTTGTREHEASDEKT